MRGYLIEGPELDAYGQMALDEVLLDSARADEATLRFYRWASSPWEGETRAVTFGYSQEYAKVSAAVRAREGAAPFPLVRRATGGGIVYHDRDVTFSFVFPWARLISPPLVYKNIHLGVHLGLKARQQASRLWSPREACAAPAECFGTAPARMDLVHEDGRKFLGGALRRRGGFGLYQGSLRTEGFALGADRLREAVCEGLGLQWRALLEPVSAEPRALAAAAALEKDRYRSEKWNKRR